MKRINPLYIALLLVVVFVFISLKLNMVKSELVDVKDDYKIRSFVSNQVSSLKVAYHDKAETKKSIDALLRFPAVKSANIDKEVKKDIIILSSKSIDKNVLNILMSRILNKTYRIHSFEIKKISRTKVSFRMDIKC